MPHMCSYLPSFASIRGREHVVDVGDLEREVVQPGALVLDAEEHVMVDVGAAPVTPVERSDDVVLAGRRTRRPSR